MDPITRAIASAAAGAAGADATYVDDVFSTFLYEGNGGPQTIANGIDLSGEGGLVWVKDRENGSDGSPEVHGLFDTERGVYKRLETNSSASESSNTESLKAFNSNGFTLGTYNRFTESGTDYVSWTFRKAPGFFDVVTYTGTGDVHTISHNLNSVPGMIIVKCTSHGSTDWTVYHREGNQPGYSAASFALFLNTTAAADPSAAYWNNTSPTSTNFTVYVGDKTNGNGKTYVAYLFAHDDARFGTNEDEALVKCGSYTGTGSAGNRVELGFEPQFVIIKSATYSDSYTDWYMMDTMRGFGVTTSNAALYANKTSAENPTFGGIIMSGNGFELNASGSEYNKNNERYIYMAIRRPNKPPAAGTEVFAMDYFTGSTPNYISNFAVDAVINREGLGVDGNDNYFASRLTGKKFLKTNTNDGAISATAATFDYQNGFSSDSGGASTDKFAWMFKRAPQFMDVVTYIGDGASTRTVNHNLTVAPEMMIVKKTNNSANWQVYHSSQGNTKYSPSFRTDPFYTSSNRWKDTTPTSTQFTLGSDSDVNGASAKYLALLFATLSGISKVGSYSGSGSAQNIDCGFTNGARFVLIKRADSEVQGSAPARTNWYLWDSERGIVSGNDPWIALNMTDAQVTGTDYIDPLNAGFTVNASGTGLNASGGTYIFLAIA